MHTLATRHVLFRLEPKFKAPQLQPGAVSTTLCQTAAKEESAMEAARTVVTIVPQMVRALPPSTGSTALRSWVPESSGPGGCTCRRQTAVMVPARPCWMPRFQYLLLQKTLSRAAAPKSTESQLRRPRVSSESTIVEPNPNPDTKTSACKQKHLMFGPETFLAFAIPGCGTSNDTRQPSREFAVRGTILQVSARAQLAVPAIKFHSLRCSISQPCVSLPLHAEDRVRRAAPSRACLSATKQRRAGA